jgi:hypothetical protein
MVLRVEFPPTTKFTPSNTTGVAGQPMKSISRLQNVAVDGPYKPMRMFDANLLPPMPAQLFDNVRCNSTNLLAHSCENMTQRDGPLLRSNRL